MKIHKLVGPGLIVAATGLGAGDIIAASVAGANYGSVLLWAVLLGAVLKFCLNEGIARWQLVTGTTFLEGWIDHLPKLLSWYFLIYLLLWSFMVSAALMAATGLAAHAIMPAVSVQEWGIIHALVASAIVLKGKYKFLETVMKVFIGIMFLSVMICAWVVMPPITDTLASLVTFALPQDSLVYVLGIIGGVGGSVTIMSYGYWMREAGWHQTADMHAMRVDLLIAYSLTALFAIAIMLVSAGVNVDVVSGNNMAIAVAEQLIPVLGEPGKWLFLIGFWGAVFSSMIGVWHGVPYLFANFYYHFRDASREADESKDMNSSPAYRGYLLYLGFLPMSLLALDKPVWIIILYAVTGALFMPLVAGLLLYMNGVRKWLGKYANSWFVNGVLIICLLLFGVLLVVKLQAEFG